MPVRGGSTALADEPTSSRPSSSAISPRDVTHLRPFAQLLALNRTVSGWWCAVGWLVAAAALIGWTQLLHGPSQADSFESAFSTWAIAHGHLGCAYPPTARDSPLIAPLWPLLSGGAAAITQLGHGVPFPSASALGPHCTTAVTAMTQWSTRSNVLPSTVRLGYLSWFALLGVPLLFSVRRVVVVAAGSC